MVGILRRIVFYGIIVSISFYLFGKVDLCLSGKNGFILFGIFAFLGSVIQSVNFLVIRKIGDLDKLSDLGVWSQIRLKNRIDPRRSIAFQRAVTGIIFSLITGVLSAYMKVMGESLIPTWLISSAVATAFISLILILLTVYEFYALTVFESEMSAKSKKNTSKKEALKALRKES
tara:strand:+ start:9374 stop:9895 length:522 start_codon:yes stop_codon:yes gene_type:complete